MRAPPPCWCMRISLVLRTGHGGSGEGSCDRGPEPTGTLGRRFCDESPLCGHSKPVPGAEGLVRKDDGPAGMGSGPPREEDELLWGSGGGGGEM